MVDSNIRFSRADQLTVHLQERCITMAAGEKFLSVRQIMEEYQVSQITVRQAIEKLCESGMLEAEDRRGYFVRRDRRHGRIAALMPRDYGHMKRELSRLLDKQSDTSGFELEVIEHTGNSDAIAKMGAVKADAILFIPWGYEALSTSHLNRMQALPVPVVLLYCTLPMQNFRYVDCDNEFCGVLAASHLLMNGHRKLALMITEPRIRAVNQRMEGFLRTAKAFHLGAEILDPGIVAGDDSPARSAEFLKNYLQRHRQLPFTALFTLSEDPTFELLQVCRECGVDVPTEFSMITVGHTGPRKGWDITSINSRRDLVAEYALKIIRDHFNHTAGAPLHYRITPEIHEGVTVRSIRS